MKFAALPAALAVMSLMAAHAAPPPVPIEQALKLAQEHLAGRGLAGAHYIDSLTLEGSSLIGGEKYWLIRWVPEIRTGDKTETALRINQDGSLVRLVTGASGSRASQAPGRPPLGGRR